MDWKQGLAIYLSETAWVLYGQMKNSPHIRDELLLSLNISNWKFTLPLPLHSLSTPSVNLRHICVPYSNYIICSNWSSLNTLLILTLPKSTTALPKTGLQIYSYASVIFLCIYSVMQIFNKPTELRNIKPSKEMMGKIKVALLRYFCFLPNCPWVCQYFLKSVTLDIFTRIFFFFNAYRPWYS